ncbi:MAG: 50S ribosomal protein L9 [Planctomycetaceae bacterium]|nr:MAG: 50S ribosomal protein L9 [Planctomycetaceae bacterium]
MKVLLRRNVAKLGKIGELVIVKDGYARNYLLPQRLAVAPTEANVKAVENEKAKYLAELARLKAEFELRAAAVNGKEITISARANEEGSLYGSVGPAQIAAALAAEGIVLEVENIQLATPIRRLDKYDVGIGFSEDVMATIHVWVVPIREHGDTEPAEQTDKSADDESSEE